jgi:hypothetical protein
MVLKNEKNQVEFGGLKKYTTFVSDYSLYYYDGETGKNITIGPGALR